MTRLCTYSIHLECRDAGTCSVTTGGCVRKREDAIRGRITLKDALNTSLHPAAEKQREQMHKAIARDAKMRDEEHATLRRKAEAADARRNQPITRGEILDALNAAAERAYERDGDAYATICLIREAFE